MTRPPARRCVCVNCFPTSTSVNVCRCYDVTWQILLLKPCGFSWYIPLTPSRESVTIISAFKGCGNPLSLKITWPCQLIRRKRHYTLFSVRCSYLYLQEILHYYRKIKFIAITLKVISWTSLSYFISYQPILFKIILYFTIQYFKTNYVCRGLLYLFTGWILDDLQTERSYFIWYSGVT
jgi:hypothetical protein